MREMNEVKLKLKPKLLLCRIIGIARVSLLTILTQPHLGCIDVIEVNWERELS